MKNQGKRESQAMIYFWPRQKKTYQNETIKSNLEKHKLGSRLSNWR
jgi:hypothetical protein